MKALGMWRPGAIETCGSWDEPYAARNIGSAGVSWSGGRAGSRHVNGEVSHIPRGGFFGGSCVVPGSGEAA
jgi:hypothetical protein